MRLLARRPPPALTMAVGRRHPRLTPARYVPSPRQDPGALAPIDKEEKEGEEEEERGLDLLRSAIPFQYRILDVADACLADYCSTAPPEARERRLEVREEQLVFSCQELGARRRAVGRRPSYVAREGKSVRVRPPNLLLFSLHPPALPKT